MKDKILQYGTGISLTLLLFCYAGWGDFSWLTLTGPLALEPRLETLEGPGYTASPALQALIIRLFFLTICCFFCMIPRLARGLRRHAPFLLGLLAAVYALFAYLLGTGSFFTATAPGSASIRILSLICGAALLLICHVPGSYADSDAGQKNFQLPSLLTKRNFLAPLFCLFAALCLLHGLIFQGCSWLLNSRPSFILLRVGIVLSALTGALAFHAKSAEAKP